MSYVMSQTKKRCPTTDGLCDNPDNMFCACTKEISKKWRKAKAKKKKLLKQTKKEPKMSDKVFIGSGKIVKTKFGDLTKISFSESDIDKLKANLNNGWINLVVKEKNPDKQVAGKPTHYLEVDTWKPNTDKDGGQSVSQFQQASDDLPF